MDCLHLVAAWIAVVSHLYQRGNAFRIGARRSTSRGIPGKLHSDHIDEMMFECAVYNENLRFPRNVQSELNPHAEKDPRRQAQLDQLSLELTKRQLEIYKKRKEHMRLTLPISGEVTRPSGGHLRELYYIVEEHNRELLENELSRIDLSSDTQVPIDIDAKRKLVLPTQMWRIFDSPEVTQTYRLFPTTIKSQSPLVPGQVSTITLQEEHRQDLIDHIRSTNLFGIAVAFIQSSRTPEEESEISPHACMCEFVDVSDLDTTGKIVVRAAQRLSILKVVDASKAVLKVGGSQRPWYPYQPCRQR